MYEDVDRSEWTRSDESVRLWEQHTREYAAAGAAYIARAEAICTAAHDRLEAMFGPPPQPGPFGSDAWQAYFAMSARVLEVVLPELRAVPPPEAFLEEFGRACAAGDRLVAQLREGGVAAAFALEDQGWFATHPGLRECTFDLPR